MLKDGVVLTVLLLIVAGAGYVWISKPPAYYGAPVQVQQPEPASKPAPVVRARPRLKPEPVVEEIAETTLALAPVTVAASPMVHGEPLPFPAVEQISKGVREESITGKYGYPQLSAVTSTGGHLVETMVYARERGRLATIIRIEDGKVSSAYSQTEPVVPAGMSAPSRWQHE
jgi:hypothetical protein